ncbi:hypothetical protein GCM10009712_20430 [Pseudarthrobacter sulfonivorans]
MICMVPMAPAEEVTFWRKVDSCIANASPKDGSTPIRRAVSATMAFSSTEDGVEEGAEGAIALSVSPALTVWVDAVVGCDGAGYCAGAAFVPGPTLIFWPG